MKLQPSSKKEIKRIAVGIAVCDVIMIAGLFLLSQFGIGTFSYRIFIGALGGSAIALLNFTIMCLTVQYATTIEEQKPVDAAGRLGHRLFCCSLHSSDCRCSSSAVPLGHHSVPADAWKADAPGSSQRSRKGCPRGGRGRRCAGSL